MRRCTGARSSSSAASADAPRCDALVTASGRRAVRAGRRLRAGGARRRRRRCRRRGARRAAGRRRRSRRQHRRRDAARSGPPTSRRGSVRMCAAAATRCLPQMRAEVAAVEPGRLRLHHLGNAVARPGRGRRRPSSPRPAARSTTDSRCTRESDDLFSYRRDGAGSGRRPAWWYCEARAGWMSPGDRRDPACGSAAVQRARSPRRPRRLGGRPTTSRWSW